MGLTIYGTAASRAARPLWVASELGLVYNHIATPYLGGATRTAKFLAINPNGHIPAIDDRGVIVWESMACALYLAERFSTPASSDLWARTAAELADVLRWAFWAVTEIEKDALVFLMHTQAMDAERRKPALARDAERRLVKPLQVLEQHLQRVAAQRAQGNTQAVFLAGQRFTVADVCVASVLAWVIDANDLLRPVPAVCDWLQRCVARPAYAKVNLLTKSA